MSQRNVTVHPGGTERLSHWLIHHAAGHAPKSLSQRLEEEWLADLTARPGAMSRLRFAIGCCWATQVITLEYQPSRVPVTSSVAEGKLRSGYAHLDLGYFSRRSSTLFLVVSLHAALFYGLVTTLSHIRGSAIPTPLQYRPLENPHPRELPMRLSDPRFDSVKIDAPIPEIDLPREADPSHEVPADFVPESSPRHSPPTPPHMVKQVQGGPGTGFPNPDDFYPAQAKRREEQGIATLRVCVDVNGRLTSDPTILQGSGSDRLDEGALQLARAGSGHYRATAEDGQPVNSCYAFRIRFQLKN